jgi:hypothetical protein
MEPTLIGVIEKNPKPLGCTDEKAGTGNTRQKSGAKRQHVQPKTHRRDGDLF